MEKDLANLWSRKKITKKAHAGRGLETIWEIPDYCFLNLAKALLVRAAPVEAMAAAMHGIGDPPENKEGYVTLGKQTILTNGALTTRRLQIFPNLCNVLGQPLPAIEINIPIKSLLRRVLGIHRAYMKAFREDSRFLKLRQPEFMACQPPNGNHLWLRFFLRHEDFNTTVSLDKLNAALTPTFTAVTPGIIGASLQAHCFESSHLAFSNTAIDELPLLMAAIRPKIQVLVLPQEYLFYVMHETETPMPQAAVIYAIMFYLGSIVRYRPYDFDKLIEKKYRWVIDEYLQTAPKQFVILMVNEITQSEVSYFEG